MAQIIDMFTRQPITAEAGGGSVAREDETRRWFKEAARSGPENLEDREQEEWVVLFHQYYLAQFLDAVEGIAEATSVKDLEYFMGIAVGEMSKWPKS